MIRMIRKFTFASLLVFGILGAYAQPKAKYAKTEYQLGTIAWKSQARTSLKLTNSGNKPLQITAVDPGCECTVVKWDKSPIAPGGSAVLDVVYDAKTLGTFRREIAVTTNAAEEPTYLTLTGCVKANLDEDASPLAYKLSNVSISTELIEFDDVVMGQHPSVTVTVKNDGKKEYTPEFLNMPKWLSFKAYPEVILPGNSGRVTFTLNSEELSALGLTQTNIYIARYHGDKKHNSTEISVCATLVPQVARPAVEENSAATTGPVAVLPAKLGMGKKFGKKRVREVVFLENKGDAPLHVSAIQVYNPAITVVLGKTTIDPGEKASLKVTANSNILQFKQHPRILIISDDPVRPKLSIDLTADEQK